MIQTSDPRDIGKKIKTLRRLADLTQAELGLKIGVTKATINKYEYGTVNFTRARIEQLAKVFNVSPSYLLGWDDSDELPAISVEPDVQDQMLDEIIRIYKGLNIKERNQLLSYAYTLEETN